MQMVQIPVRKHVQTAHIIQIHHAALFQSVYCVLVYLRLGLKIWRTVLFVRTPGVPFYFSHTKNSFLQFYRVGCQVGFALLIDEDIFYALSYEQATHETKSELYQN